MASYGPCHDHVERLLARMRAFPWFRSIGEPVEGAVRGDLHWLAAHQGVDRRWGPDLPKARKGLERIYFSVGRFDVLDAIYRAARAAVLVDPALLDELDRTWAADSGYYGDTLLTPRELLPDPHEIPVGAVLEAGLCDVPDVDSVFDPLLSWLEAGHWPLGRTDEGSIVVW